MQPTPAMYCTVYSVQCTVFANNPSAGILSTIFITYTAFLGLAALDVQQHFLFPSIELFQKLYTVLVTTGHYSIYFLSFALCNVYTV